jgi:hypothetical protein
MLSRLGEPSRNRIGAPDLPERSGFYYQFNRFLNGICRPGCTGVR